MSPWKRIASTACAPLAPTRRRPRPHNRRRRCASPPRPARAGRRPNSPWARIASTVCAPLALDAADDLVRVGGDGAAHHGRRSGKLGGDRFAVRVDGFGGLGKARRDDIAVGSQRLRGLGAAGGNAAHDGVRMGADGVARLKRRPPRGERRPSRHGSEWLRGPRRCWR